jgi:hypothetical protein
MFEWFEEVCKSHEHSIAAFEALSTFAAVVIALWLSHRAGATRLTAYVTKEAIFDAATDDRPEYLVAVITNTGTMTFYISLSFLLWTRPYRKTVGWILSFPIDYWGIDKNIQQRTYPVELQPKASKHLFISDISTFRQVIRECLLSQTPASRIIFRFVRATIQTVDGKFFRAKISKSIRGELRQIQKKLGGASR